jgi:polar amino acid transport system substrate-binding protein
VPHGAIYKYVGMMNRRELICAFAGAAAGCGIPRDPKHTFDRVRQYHTVRAAISENPPWVIRTAGEPAGAEVDLIRQFAIELGAAPQWVWGSEQRHMQALQHFEVDLLAAGLDKSTPWKKSVGITRPYFEDRVLVGIPPSMQQPASLDGMTVAVRSGDQTAAILIQKHASPQRVTKLSSGGIAVVGPDWRVEQLGYVPTRFELRKVSHVMAVPPGENGWLKRLEEFLFRRQSSVKQLLQQEAAKE